MRLLLLALLLPACSLYFAPNDPGPPAPDGGGGGSGGAGGYDLRKVKAIAGEHTIAGVDSDGAGGLWIVYRDPTGDYYTLADVYVTHLDATLTKVSEWLYRDEYTQISGITFTGDAVWISYNSDGGTGNDHLRKLDPTTGATTGTFATEVGIVDLSYDPDRHELLLSNLWNQIVALDASTGGETWRIDVPTIEYSTQRGLAFAGGNMWVAAGFSSELYFVDHSGAILGSGTSAALPASDAIGDDLQLAWDGHDVLAVHGNQIFWLEPHR